MKNNRKIDIAFCLSLIAIYISVLLLTSYLIGFFRNNHDGINEYGEEYKVRNGIYQYKICSLDDIPMVAYYYANGNISNINLQRRHNQELCKKAGGTWDWEQFQAIPIVELGR